MAGVHGSGIPLAFCYVETTKDAGTGAKEQLLKKFLEKLKERGVNPKFTLTDKDISAINAMRAIWPRAKHQLCFWHALRALKQRLAKKTKPVPYDVDSAVNEFPFIDRTFVPISQEGHKPVSIRITDGKVQLLTHFMFDSWLPPQSVPSAESVCWLTAGHRSLLLPYPESSCMLPTLPAQRRVQE